MDLVLRMLNHHIWFFDHSGTSSFQENHLPVLPYINNTTTWWDIKLYTVDSYNSRVMVVQEPWFKPELLSWLSLLTIITTLIMRSRPTFTNCAFNNCMHKFRCQVTFSSMLSGAPSVKVCSQMIAEAQRRIWDLMQCLERNACSDNKDYTTACTFITIT